MQNSLLNLQHLIFLEWKDLPAEEIEKKLENAVVNMGNNYVIFIKKEGDDIYFGQIPFAIRNGKLNKVGFIHNKSNRISEIK